MAYVGRFAPSPTGPLHVGSLAAAVASYLHARRAGGEWLVRIEDIDPPREIQGASDNILRTLDAFGLHWDRSVLYQSSRLEAYRSAADALISAGYTYRCVCSRKEVQQANGGTRRYPGTCRTRVDSGGAAAMRVRVEPEVRTFIDGIQGRIDACVDATEGDYLIVRRDGLPAYHLAVVVDDAFQGVNTIVRGADLLDSTGVHLHLQKMLKVAEPAYFHVPIVADAFGQKLSKQTGATGVGLRYVPSLANRVLEHLGIHPPSELANAPSRELWPWAVQHTSFKELICRQSIHSQ